MKKIIFTGGSGKFGKVFKKFFSNKSYILYPSSKIFDITNIKKMEKFIKKIKPKFIVHAAAISRPMELHEKNIINSINTNIIGTSNIVNICQKYNIKLIYFSTNYVYPSKKGNYKEDNPVLPINNYAWSKMGGECAVQMLNDSLILRLSMTDYPFAYKKAIKNAYSSFIYNKDFARILPYLLNQKGIINIGGKRQSIFNFAKKNNSKIKGLKIMKNSKFPKDSSINTKKFEKILKKLKINKIND